MGLIMRPFTNTDAAQIFLPLKRNLSEIIMKQLEKNGFHLRANRSSYS
ncbi:hypothetical protein I580_00265 [Enterococcus caccae ATCC BAA-1240]|uniref:Uncharacterized protein n=1 Tax=Enterococcus caccae ATCC BAA-1240 TaxID=1158612 RepID=R3W881_9ENTE|nr:hypothetical protein UC7_03047 [Enterococcus caccae ATCC BAA-1240]EOT67883.1 hypothetical protein I580_00265 [Enterococcus caccae ATCC BAA-1240]